MLPGGCGQAAPAVRHPSAAGEARDWREPYPEGARPAAKVKTRAHPDAGWRRRDSRSFRFPTGLDLVDLALPRRFPGAALSSRHDGSGKGIAAVVRRPGWPAVAYP